MYVQNNTNELCYDAAVLSSAATAPWWGSGLFTLLGAAIAQGANLYINRRKRKDDRETSYRTLRRDAITHFIGVTNRALNDPLDKAAQIEMHAGYTLLELSVPENLRHLSAIYYEASVGLHGQLEDHVEDTKDAYDRWTDAEDHLLAAARASYKDLGLPRPE